MIVLEIFGLTGIGLLILFLRAKRQERYRPSEKNEYDPR